MIPKLARKGKDMRKIIVLLIILSIGILCGSSHAVRIQLKGADLAPRGDWYDIRAEGAKPDDGVDDTSA